MKRNLLVTFAFLGIFLFSCQYNNENTRRTAIDVLKENPDEDEIVLPLDKPWEKGISFPCICKNTDTKIYYLYYSVWTGNDNYPFVNCIAISDDGKCWDKPDLPIYKWNGYESNIISTEFENFTVSYYDGLFYLVGYKREGKKETIVKTSSDGVYFDKQVNSINYVCDSSNELLKKDDKYFLYLRSWYEPKNENIEYSHVYNGYRVYRGVSLVKLNSIDQNLYKQRKKLMIWGESLGSALTDEYYPIVMKNLSDEDYDIYNPCIHIYDDGSVIAYPILYYHINSNKGNDGYSKIGFWISSDLERFEQIDNKYIESNYWLEFAQGHYEDGNKYIHYYVNTNITHGSSVIGNTELRARVHYKK